MPYIDKNYKPNRGDRAILAILRVFSKKRKKTKSFDTARTKDASARLRQAGLSQMDIDRLRGKKKK